MISEAIIVALITGACAIIAQLLISKQTSKDLYAKLDKHQAVMDTKMDELTREVRKHNDFAERIPILETKLAVLEKKG